MKNLSHGQKIDEKIGILYPWYTPQFLDELRTWDLKDKKVFEYGGGDSSIWWAMNAESLVVAESDAT